MRTRLQAAAAKVNIHATRSRPRNRVLRCGATVFIQPKTSSTRFLFRWLIAYPHGRVVRPSIARRRPDIVLRHMRCHVVLTQGRDELPRIVAPVPGERHAQLRFSVSTCPRYPNRTSAPRVFLNSRAKSADDILASVARFCQRTSVTGH